MVIDSNCCVEGINYKKRKSLLRLVPGHEFTFNYKTHLQSVESCVAALQEDYGVCRLTAEAQGRKVPQGEM
jgi:hypothetical protein